MRFLKILILIMIVFTGTYSGIIAEETKYEGIERINDDKTPSGYNVDFNPMPFSPVLDPEFCLGDTSFVFIFLTDTMYNDTVIMLDSVLMLPGYYRLLNSEISKYYEKYESDMLIVHIEMVARKNNALTFLKKSFKSEIRYFKF
ncbi:MAG: hypothetical protein ABIJ45_12500 [Candidatus Zixiibacteriota bacterium]